MFYRPFSGYTKPRWRHTLHPRRFHGWCCSTNSSFLASFWHLPWNQWWQTKGYWAKPPSQSAEMFLYSLLNLERGEPETTYLGSSGSNSQKGFDGTKGFKLEPCKKVQCANVAIDIMIACFVLIVWCYAVFDFPCFGMVNSFCFYATRSPFVSMVQWLCSSNFHTLQSCANGKKIDNNSCTNHVGYHDDQLAALFNQLRVKRFGAMAHINGANGKRKPPTLHIGVAEGVI